MKTKIYTREDLNKILKKNLREIQKSLKCDLITLYLYDSERDRVYFPVGIGLTDEEHFLQAMPSRKRLVGKIIKTQKPIIADDALHHADFTGPFTHLEQIKSGAGFPVFAENNELRGFIFVNYRQPHHFTRSEETKINDWANQIGEIVVAAFSSEEGKNLQVRLRKETDLRSKEYRLLELVKQIQTINQDVDIVLWLEKPRERVLSVSIDVGVDAALVHDAKISINDVSNIVVKSYKEQRVINVDLASIQRNIFNIDEPIPWKRLLAIPVVSENHKLGVLCVLPHGKHKITPRDQEELQTFARLMAVTIRNEDRIIIQNALHDLGIYLAQSHELGNILQEVVKSAYETLDADVATVHLYDPDKQEYFPLNQAAVFPESAREFMETPRSGGLTDIIIQRQRMFVEDVDKEKGRKALSTFIKEQKIKAYVGVPLISQKSIVGVLYVSFKYPRHFSPDELSLIQLLADYAATAISNARLMNNLETRVITLKTLHTVGEELVSISDKPEELNTILNRIVKDAQEVLKADIVYLYQYDQNYDEFDPKPAQSGMLYEPEIVKEKIHKDDILYEIITLDRPKYYPNARGDDSLTRSYTIERANKPAVRFVVREKVESSAAIPLQIGTQKVGVMFANFRTGQTFHESQQELMEIFAHQAAIAIHNSRLFRESLLKSERLELVRDVAATVSAVTERNAILQKAVDGLAKVFNVKQSAVALFDKAGEFSIVEVEYLEPGCVPAKGHRIPLKDNPQIEWILENKRPLIIYDVQNDPIMAKTKEIMTTRKTLSLMVVPIVLEDKVIGTIGVDAIEQQRYFTDEESKLAQAIADQAAAAIRIANQIEEIKQNLDRRIKDIKSLREITEEMHQGKFEMVLKLIAEQAVELTGAKYGGVWLLNKEGTLLEIGGVAGENRSISDLPKLSIDEHSFNGWVMQTKQPQICNDTREETHYREWYADARSELAVPLFYHDKVIGTLDVESTAVDNFTSDHQQLLEAMAGQAAVVVQNARLLERLNVLDDIGLKLTSEVHLKKEEIFEAIYSQVIQLTGAQDMYIALYDEETGDIRFPLATEKGKRVQYLTRKADMEKRGTTEEIIFTRKPILHKTKKDAEKWYGQPGHEERVGLINPSWLGVPMMVGKRALGVIAIYDWGQEHAYDEQDLQVFSAMASQAAFSLVNQELNRRNAALTSLNEIGTTLTSGIRLKEEEIVNLIFTETQNLTGAQDLYIARYDEETGEICFALATEKGERVTYPSRKANMEKRGKTEEIIFTRKPILHRTMREAKEWYSQFGHAEYIGNIQPSWLGVPMMVGERVLGIIAAVDLEKEYVFDELDREVLLSMANQAAIALDNSRLYYGVNQQLEIANKGLETVQEIINAVEIYADLPSFLQAILDNMLSRINASSGTIQLYDAKREELIIWARAGNIVNRSYEHIPLNKGITGKAAREKHIVYEPNIKGSSDYLDYFAESRSELAIPMVVGDTLIGIINAEDPKFDAFDEYSRRLVERLAFQLPILIRQKQKAQEYEEKKLTDQVNRSLGLITAEVAHKVGNDAGKIRVYTREQIDNLVEGDPQKEIYRKILSTVEGMIDATDDLFKPFAKEDKAETGVNEMVRVTISQCHIPENIHLSVNLDENLPKTRVQVRKVQSYMVELLTNAIKYETKGMAEKKSSAGSVEIMSCRGKNDFIEIHFTNHGPSISPDRWDSIFKVFSARGQHTKNEQSYGLGLWGARTAMQEQGGNVMLLESNDQNTTFVVLLPII